MKELTFVKIRLHNRGLRLRVVIQNEIQALI